MLEQKIPERYVDDVGKISKRIKSEFRSNKHYYGLGHKDADGICSQAILAYPWRNEGIPHNFFFLEREFLDEIKNIFEQKIKIDSNKKLVLCTDLGSRTESFIASQCNNIGTYGYILDHHESKTLTFPNLSILNPAIDSSYNIDSRISAAVISYDVLYKWASRKVRPTIAKIACIGAKGDDVSLSRMISVSSVSPFKLSGAIKTKSSYEIDFYGQRKNIEDITSDIDLLLTYGHSREDIDIAFNLLWNGYSQEITRRCDYLREFDKASSDKFLQIILKGKSNYNENGLFIVSSDIDGEGSDVFQTVSEGKVHCAGPKAIGTFLNSLIHKYQSGTTGLNGVIKDPKIFVGVQPYKKNNAPIFSSNETDIDKISFRVVKGFSEICDSKKNSPIKYIVDELRANFSEYLKGDAVHTTSGAIFSHKSVRSDIIYSIIHNYQQFLKSLNS